MNTRATTLSVELQVMESTFEQRALMKMWAAVFTLGLQDAAAEFKRFSTQKVDPPKPMDAYPALIWLNSGDTHTGSFEWLCELFDIEPAKARSAWRLKVRALAKQAAKLPQEKSE